MSTQLFIVIMIILVVLALFVIPRFLMKRAIKQVIQIFRRYRATNAESAKTVVELGLRPRGFLENMFRRRDYKPSALELLIRIEIVKVTDDGRLYLFEQRLNDSGLLNKL